MPQRAAVGVAIMEAEERVIAQDVRLTGTQNTLVRLTSTRRHREEEASRQQFGAAETMLRALEVPAGGVFSVVLGNRSTHARYFLPSEMEATSLLELLWQET